MTSIEESQQELRSAHKDILELAERQRAEALAEALPEPLRGLRREEGFELTFLGTGAAIPSKYRNVSAIFVDLFEGGTMLVDCGEGSLSQLIRRFGREGALERVARLKMIWISHFHADHHGGMYEVLRVSPRVDPGLRRLDTDASAPPPSRSGTSCSGRGIRRPQRSPRSSSVGRGRSSGPWPAWAGCSR